MHREQEFVIPEFVQILTAKGQPLAIPSSQQSRMALLLLSEETREVCAISESHATNEIEFASLMAMAERKRFFVVQEGVVTVQALRQLYAATSSDEKDGSAPSRQGKITDRPDAERMLSEMVAEARRLRATDIHVNISNNAAKGFGTVEFRIDGYLKKQPKYSGGESARETLHEIMSVAYGSLADTGSTSNPNFLLSKNQYCAISVPVKNETVHLRYQSIGANKQTKFALRVPLHEDACVRSFSDLGFADSHCELMDLGRRRNRGLIVTCGVTGSGKSTTNFNMIMTMPGKNEKVINTVEDPIERPMDGVTQTQVQRSTAEVGVKVSPFAGLIRDILRADPDAIVVSELRDPDTGEAIVTAVLTGHQVYTSLHVGSAFEAIIRLTQPEIGVTREVVSSRNFLNLIIYQHLLAIVCPHCCLDHREARDAGLLTKRMESNIKNKFSISIESLKFKNENGCSRCNYNGTIGRTTAAEVVLMNNDLRRLIAAGKDREAEDLWRATRKTNFSDSDCTGKTAYEHALYKMSQGLIDPREIEAAWDPFDLYEIFSVEGVE